MRFPIGSAINGRLQRRVRRWPLGKRLQRRIDNRGVSGKSLAVLLRIELLTSVAPEREFQRNQLSQQTLSISDFKLPEEILDAGLLSGSPLPLELIACLVGALATGNRLLVA